MARKEKQTETWHPDRLLRVLLIWTSVTFIIFWLPAVRGLMDGATYTWRSFGQFGGSGTSGDYWFPILLSGFAIFFLYLGWRGARRSVRAFLLVWHLFLAGGALRLALAQPDSFRFRGDTLGVDVSLAWAGPVLFGSFAVMTLWWVVQDWGRSRERPLPEWNARNSRLLLLLIGIVPVQYVLLRFGPPDGLTDQIGVLLTIGQWLLLNVALYPWAARKKRGGRPRSVRRMGT